MDLVRDFHRGAVRLHVLFHAKSEDVFGAAIAMEIARHGHSVSPGTLYPLLHDLEAAGDLTSTTVVVGGHRRRCYRITPQGRRTLEACTAALRELADEVLEP
ncbi:MAG TPA: PadR family transcriptional regulator [Acidimicrobiales bacterium]|jgi:DNA-binding PadR family transcriptional regulator|nr:PadR family transcriptional regulator [Acidimicrobiales bacterium]